jgi:hypothetical protein
MAVKAKVPMCTYVRAVKLPSETGSVPINALEYKLRDLVRHRRAQVVRELARVNSHRDFGISGTGTERRGDLRQAGEDSEGCNRQGPRQIGTRQ